MIYIYNLDAITWFFEVCIQETELMDLPFELINTKRTETDWVHCSVEHVKTFGKVFRGHGGLFNLSEMIKIFRDWAEPVWQRELSGGP